MQVFDVEYSKNGLRDFLVAHGGLDYFDEIEVGEDVQHNNENYYRTVLRKDGAEIPIDITQISSGGRQMWINNTSWDFYNSWTNAPHSILKGYVTDSAIVFIPRSVGDYAALYGCPLIICKSQKGYPCVIHGRYETYGSYVPWPGYDSRNKYENTTVCIVISDGVKSSIVIGNSLILSRNFPPLYTVHAAFTAHGVPSVSLCLCLINQTIRSDVIAVK